MEDSRKPDESQQETEAADARIAQPITPPPQEPPTGTETKETSGNQEPSRPLLVRLTGDDALKPFETQTLAISRKTYWIAICALGAALAAAIFVGSQVKIMSYQTKIMGDQANSGVAGAIESERNTRRQLDIAQQQAKAAQDSVKAIQHQMQQDQRAWVKLETVHDSFQIIDGGYVSVIFVVTNIGKTVARQLNSTLVIKPINAKDIATVTYRRGMWVNGSTVGAVWPQDPPYETPVTWKAIDPKTGIAGRLILSHANYLDFQNGNLYFLTYGRTDYVDIFGARHRSTFCSYHVAQRQFPVFARKCTDYTGAN